MHNHLEHNYHLCNKKTLFLNIKQYFNSLNQDPFKIIPLTFHIKNGENVENDSEWLRFKLEFEQNKEKKDINNVWIIKPGECTNRGRGIKVSNKIEEILEIVRKISKDKSWIIQKYMEDCMLYNKRKFDLRCYLLVTIQNNRLKGYWYKDGYVRTSSKEYQRGDYYNKLIHLTNDAIQKKSDDYGKYEESNKLSFQLLNTYILNLSNGTSSFFQHVYPLIKDIAKIALKSVLQLIDPNRINNTFELFGLDFMIDNQFKPYLIEINTNPDIEYSCKLLANIIPNMLQNTLRIAVDPVFPPPDIYQCKNNKIYLPHDVIESNKYQLILDSQINQNHLNIQQSSINIYQSNQSHNSSTK